MARMKMQGNELILPSPPEACSFFAFGGERFPGPDRIPNNLIHIDIMKVDRSDLRFET